MINPINAEANYRVLINEELSLKKPVKCTELIENGNFNSCIVYNCVDYLYGV